MSLTIKERAAAGVTILDLSGKITIGAGFENLAGLMTGMPRVIPELGDGYQREED